MNIVRNMSLGMMSLLLLSCVTINIYFPEAAAERAADIIIDDVWGSRQETVTPPESNDDPEANLARPAMPVAMQVLDWFVPAAQAARVDLDISSPAIASLQASMKTRHSALSAHYASGAVGLTNSGLIAVRDAKVLALKDRNKVKALVADENKDRNALYAEIARANGHPEWADQIRDTFAARWVSNASSGWWYQQAGAWQQK